MKITDNFTSDFTQVSDSVLAGYVVRSGPYQYGDKIKYKEGKNLKQAYNIPYAIAYGSKQTDSHKEADDRMIGYFDSFKFVPKGTEGVYGKKDVDPNFDRVHAKLHTNKEIEELSDLKEFKNLPVSGSYEDLGEGDIQVVGKIHHIAVSLNANETDRCSTAGGSSCNVSLTNDFTTQDITFKEAGLRRATPEEIKEKEKKRKDPKHIEQQQWKATISEIINELQGEYKRFVYPNDRRILKNQTAQLERIFTSDRSPEKKKEWVDRTLENLWSFYKKVQDRYGYIEGVGAKIKYYVKPWTDPEFGREVAEEYEREQKEKQTFTGMGLKRKSKPSGKGRGWHGESERHSQAAKKGKKGKKDFYDQNQISLNKKSYKKLVGLKQATLKKGDLFEIQGKTYEYDFDDSKQKKFIKKQYGVLRADLSQPPTNKIKSDETMRKKKKQQDEYDEEDEEVEEDLTIDGYTPQVSPKLLEELAATDDDDIESRITGDPNIVGSQKVNTKKTVKKDMIPLEQVQGMIEAAIAKITPAINDFKKVQEAQEKSRAEDLQGKLIKEPYELPEEIVKDMTLKELIRQKEILDSTERVKDFYETQDMGYTIPVRVNKKLFDESEGNSVSKVQDMINANTKKYWGWTENREDFFTERGK